MEKFTAESNFEEMVVVATALGVAHLGVKPEDLVDLLNVKIEEIGAEAATEALNVHLTTLAESAKNLVADPAAVATEKAKNLKWHQTENAFPFADGDVVEITGGKVLVGRFAVINKPSNKAQAVKAFLFHEKTGELQATNITVDFDKIKKVDKTADEVKAEIIEAGNAKIKTQEEKKATAQKEREDKKAEREKEKQAKIAAAKAKTAQPAVPASTEDSSQTA